MKNLLTKISPDSLRMIVLIAVVAFVALFFNSQIENYLNGRLFNRISSSVAIMGLIAAAQTIVIVTRNIDLSLGSILGFVAFALGSYLADHPDASAWTLVPMALLLGAGFGAINGIGVAYFKIPAIIMTLATMAIFRSGLVEFANGQSISTNNLPTWLTSFPNMVIFSIGNLDIRLGFLITFIIVCIVWVVLRYVRMARNFYAIGSNPDAAHMLGINTKLTIFAAFTFSGALVGVAGLMFLARFGNITVVAGLGFELRSVASSVVGGVNVFGGSGNVFGAFIGSILVDLIDTSLVRWALVSEFWREAVLGALILLSVTMDSLFTRRLMKWREAKHKD